VPYGAAFGSPGLDDAPYAALVYPWAISGPTGPLPGVGALTQGEIPYGGKLAEPTVEICCEGCSTDAFPRGVAFFVTSFGEELGPGIESGAGDSP
jgi:hypothetical protein